MKRASISVNPNTKKVGRPVTTGKGELVGVRLLPDLMKALDGWKEKEGRSTRPDAVRQILTEYLKRRGFLEKE